MWSLYYQRQAYVSVRDVVHPLLLSFQESFNNSEKKVSSWVNMCMSRESGREMPNMKGEKH